MTLHADGKIEVDYGDSRLVLYNLECTTDDCLAERGSQLANIIANETKSLEVPEIDTGTEGKWEDHGYWEWEWIPPTGEFIPAVISTSWSVSWNDVETTFDLDLHQNATSSGTGSNGTEDSMEWKETTGSATVRYKKVHDYTDYIWTIINPEGQFVETHTAKEGETVYRTLYSPAGTWSCVVVPRHYYHIERVIDYMITGTRYKKIPVYKEECDTCYDYDPVTGEKIGEHDCDCGDVFDRYEIESESLGSYNGIDIADDYAHHPAELKVTLEAAMEMGYNRVWAVFQPFTFSRTAILMDDFAEVLRIPDKCVMTEIMGSREVNTYNVYTSQLAEKIPGSVWFNTFEEVAQHVFENAESGDLVITLGCGDIYKAAKILINKYQNK